MVKVKGTDIGRFGQELKEIAMLRFNGKALKGWYSGKEYLGDCKF